MVDLGFGLQAIEILGVGDNGVKVRTVTMDPESYVWVPARLITGYRPQDHPEIVKRVEHRDLASWRMTENQWKVLSSLAAAGDDGMIDDEHELVNGLGRDTAGKRRLELTRKGFVVETDKQRLTRRHQSARVWAISPAGRRALALHDASVVAV